MLTLLNITVFFGRGVDSLQSYVVNHLRYSACYCSIRLHFVCKYCRL